MKTITTETELKSLIQTNTKFKAKVSLADAEFIIKLIDPSPYFRGLYPKYPEGMCLFYYGDDQLLHSPLDSDSFKEYEKDRLPEYAINVKTKAVVGFKSQLELVKYLCDGGKIRRNRNKNAYYSFVDDVLKVTDIELGTGSAVETSFYDFGDYCKYEVREMTLEEIEELVGCSVKIIK